MSDTGNVRNYSKSEVNVIVNSRPITALAEGDAVTIAYEGSDVGYKQAADGTVVYHTIPNNMKKVTIRTINGNVYLKRGD